MNTELDYTLPPAVRRIANAFRLTGWVSFWAQAVLALISSLVLLFALVNVGARAGRNANPGAGVGLFLAALGLLAVYLSAYWAFRYTLISRKLRSRNVAKRPSPKEAIQALRTGILISMTGMLITLFRLTLPSDTRRESLCYTPLIVRWWPRVHLLPKCSYCSAKANLALRPRYP